MISVWVKKGAAFPFARQQNFSRVQIKSICRQRFQCGSKKVQLFFYWAENIVEEGENAG